jgi:N12 class adenine-specific DNA methylase
MHVVLTMPVTITLRRAGTIVLSGIPSMHCEISRKVRRLQFTTSESLTAVETAKKLFEENLRLPARVVFAPCRRIRVKKVIKG